MKDEDLFGQALMDYYNGKRHKLEMERDDGLLDEQDMTFYFKDFDKFPESEKIALKYAKGQVLDIGVGAGRTALYLQGKGHEVLGIDISDLALEVCKLRGVKRLSNIDACNLRLKESSFDTAIAFFNNFGLCGTMDRVESMLKKLHGIITDDGVFLAESVDPTDTKKRIHLKYHRLNAERGEASGASDPQDSLPGQGRRLVGPAPGHTRRSEGDVRQNRLENLEDMQRRSDDRLCLEEGLGERQRKSDQGAEGDRQEVVPKLAYQLLPLPCGPDHAVYLAAKEAA